MRVLCINDSGWIKRTHYLFGLIKGPWKDVTGAAPVYGEECTVVGEAEDDDGEYYLLAEYPHGEDDGWLKEAFIPLTGEKEQESVAERIERMNTNKKLVGVEPKNWPEANSRRSHRYL